MVLSHKPSQKSHFVLRISQLSKIVQNWFCIYHLCMDLSFRRKKKFVNMLNGSQVITIFVILENSGVFIETPCILSSFVRLSSFARSSSFLRSSSLLGLSFFRYSSFLRSSSILRLSLFLRSSSQSTRSNLLFTTSKSNLKHLR